VLSVAEPIRVVYPAASQNYLTLNWLRDRIILAAKNEDLHEIMNQILAILPGVVTEYKSIDTVLHADEFVSFPPELLNSLDSAGMPTYRLLLKVGSPIILLRNIDPPKFCNGTRLCVKQMLGNAIEATILTVFIPRIPLIPTDLLLTLRDCNFQ
jgi:ATP-dependent DNA helicase PIF1